MRDKCAVHETNTAWSNLKSQWLSAMRRDEQTSSLQRKGQISPWQTVARSIRAAHVSNGRRLLRYEWHPSQETCVKPRLADTARTSRVRGSKLAVGAAHDDDERDDSGSESCGAGGILVKRPDNALQELPTGVVCSAHSQLRRELQGLHLGDAPPATSHRHHPTETGIAVGP